MAALRPPRPAALLSDAIHTMRGEALSVASLLTACQRFDLRDGTLGLDVAGKVPIGSGLPAERQKSNDSCECRCGALEKPAYTTLGDLVGRAEGRCTNTIEEYCASGVGDVRCLEDRPRVHFLHLPRYARGARLSRPRRVPGAARAMRHWWVCLRKLADPTVGRRAVPIHAETQKIK